MDLPSTLRELQKSDLFSEDYPKRSLPSAELIAIERTPDFAILVDLVCELGRARYEPSVPTLAQLWSTCGLVPVRDAAGHALRAIGTAEALASLQALIDDSDHLSRFLAVRAIFDVDPATAFERCAARFQPEALAESSGIETARAILGLFRPDSFRYVNHKKVPCWAEPQAPEWFIADARWVELCLDFRRHPDLGRAARDVLRYADQRIALPALEAALAANPPRVVSPTTSATGDYLARYRQGEREEVWRELRSYEAIDGALREEALSVARETMASFARSVEQLGERLQERGWSPPDRAWRTLYSSEDAVAIAEVEKRTGARIPVSLQAFWETVGGIDLIWNESDGSPPPLGVDLPMDEMDPLAIDAARTTMYMFDQWEHVRTGVHPEFCGPYNLDLAPDYLHKANISGGAPYGIELPWVGADPLFLNYERDIYFVDYLRLCVKWAGIPRLQRHAQRLDVRDFVAAMTDGLEPF